MPILWKKSLALLLMVSFLTPSTAVIARNTELPDIGTSALSTLSIEQEIEMGDGYLRLLRGHSPLIEDPLISDYINRLGNRLVSHASSVRMPFHFFVMASQVVNAFAFFGGNVVVHSKLILKTDTESELASVLAHEIGHVTQRHLARAMEAQKANQPYVWAGVLGSILLGLANPTAGIAALSGTMAGSVQTQLSFSQDNEKEADRVGIVILGRAGFNPSAAPKFLQKLADSARFSSTPPQMLLTHPLPLERLADIRNRVNQLKHIQVASSEDYFFAKMRLLTFDKNKRDAILLQEDYKKQNLPETRRALIYGKALNAYQHNNYDLAKKLVEPLLKTDPGNLWWLDLMTDIDIAQKHPEKAILRLEPLVKKDRINQVLQLNLANAYIEHKEWLKATTLLHQYTHRYPQDENGFELLASLYAKQHLRGEEMATSAELSALNGEFDQAIRLLTNSLRYLPNKPAFIARNQARIKQLQCLQARYKKF